MAETNAFADHAARPLAYRHRSAAAAVPLPRPVGIGIALGVSLAMWAGVIEACIHLWSFLP